MTTKRELQIAYGLAIVFLVIGVLCFSGFSSTTAPNPPVRLMFKCVAGKVLFTHSVHTDESGYGVSCSDCHHNLEEGETNPESCGSCHEVVSEDEDVPNRSDAFHSQCIGCHEDDGGPTKCNACHVM